MSLADISTLRDKAISLRNLHHGPGILVLANAWDAASARLFEQAGFRAIGTTSAGISASLGYADGQRISRDEMLSVVSRIAGVVSAPVSADMEAGYGDTPEQMAEMARATLAAGAVGLNIEDSTGRTDPPLADISLQVEKIRAIREAAIAAQAPLVINARTDVYARTAGDEASHFEQAVQRANAYGQAGADCLFVIGVKDKETIGRLVRAIDGPLNILAGAGSPTIPELEQLGVARVSVGAGPMRATMALVQRIARELLEEGNYTSFTQDTLSHAEVNRLFD